MVNPAVDPPQVEFEIVSRGFDSWNVRFRIDVQELLDQQGLLRHLRSIKRRIARDQSLTESSLVFDGILHKDRSDDSVDVVVRIRKAAVEKGDPEVRFKDGIMADGTRYSRMSAALDIFFHDTFEKPVTEQRLMKAISDSGVSAALINREIVSAKLAEVIESHLPVKGTTIAEGRFPEVGRNAEMEFYFQALAELGNTNVYYSSRRVRQGDILCRKTPATVGENAGVNVMGLALPPRAGLDISLATASGATLSFDGLEASAAADGVVVISRTLRRLKTVAGLREFPDVITLKVNPVLQVQGDSVLDIATSQTIEIIGSVQAGSRILTDCEVYVSGDVEDGTLIEAGDDVTVAGSVRGATLNSQSNVIAGRDVTDAHLVAREKIIVEGRARNSSLAAETVAAGAVAGSSILARRGVTLRSIEADENHILSTICVGMSDFFSQRIRDNEEFLEKAKANLLRIEMLVGPEIMAEINATNLQNMLLKHLARHRMGQDAQSRKQAEVYRKLLESVVPTRVLVQRKAQENDELKRRVATEADPAGSVVIVRERMEARTLLSVDGVEAEIEPLACPVEIRSEDSRVSIQPGARS